MPVQSRTSRSRGAATPPTKPKRAPVPQPHGGALVPGAGGGAQPGSGRPPSVLRDELRGSYAERTSFLTRVIDGEVMQKVEVALIDVLPHVVCPNCGEHGQQPKEMSALLTVNFTAKVSASVKDRIAAMEHMAKYGLGQLKEVSVENVRERMDRTLATIRQLLPATQAELVTRGIEVHWK
jgi:hypothetical protein